MKKLEIRIEAFDKRYKGGHMFYAMPPMDASINNYVTGQELRYGRKEGLTKEQIEGTQKISQELRQKFPYLITFGELFRGVTIRKGMTLDITERTDGSYVNEKDVAIYKFIVDGQAEVVGSSKNDCKAGKHLFYFIDKNKDAEVRVKAKRAYLSAIKLVSKNLDVNSYYELVLFINYYYGENYLIDKEGDYVLEDLINTICEKHTSGVSKFFEEHSQSQLLILKFIENGILSIVDGVITDKKGAYIGANPDEVIAYTKQKKNNLKMVHWRNALVKEDKIFAKQVEDSKNKDKE